jgi:hypothetical protein
MARFHGRRSPLGLGGGHPRGSRRFPPGSYLIIIGLTRSGDGQLTGLFDPSPVLGKLPFRHSTQRFKIYMGPRSEGDEERRHIVCQFDVAHARFVQPPSWWRQNRCTFDLLDSCLCPIRDG